MRRIASFVVLVASVAPALLFWPVFGIGPLIAPLAGLVCVLWLLGEAAFRWSPLAAARVPLSLVAGASVIVATALGSTAAGGLPTGETFSALADGAVNGWLRALDSTWPARPEPAVIVFVPLLALLAATVAVELLHRSRAPLAAVVPGLLVLAASQAYHALSGWAAVVAGLGYVVVCGAVLWSASVGAQDSAPSADARGGWRAAAPALAASVAALAVGGLAGAAVDPVERQALSLREEHRPPPLPAAAVSPVDQIADKLSRPDDIAFRARADAPVDRWRQAVFTQFDGVNWTAAARYEVLGSVLGPDPAVTVPTEAREASVEIATVSGPWLPAQDGLRSVEGIAPYVDSSTRVLVTGADVSGLRYRLTWSVPSADAAALADASVDTAAVSRLGSLGEVPVDLTELGRAAVGNQPPSLRTALVLESYFRKNFTVATGVGDKAAADVKPPPTGHAYPQLRHFLTKDKRGTSEQFATAYVVLARTIGLPARLAVGFRQGSERDQDGSSVVRNRDVLAWPEIAVSGLGWVPLDPTGTIAAAGADTKDIPSILEDQRKKLPDQNKLAQPADPPPTAEIPRTEEPPRPSAWPLWLSAGGAALLLLALAGVPTAKRIRRLRRTRGQPEAVAMGAWREARDRLRDHGVLARASMTVRDLDTASRPVVGGAALAGLDALAPCVDEALWSPAPVSGHTARAAWTAVTLVDRGLAELPLRARVLALFRLRGLLPVSRR